MDYAKFQLAVVEIAHNGCPLTVANVVGAASDRARSGREEARNALAKDGRLDLEVDET